MKVCLRLAVGVGYAIACVAPLSLYTSTRSPAERPKSFMSSGFIWMNG